MDGCGDGSWKGERYFTCSDGHAVFIVLSKLKPDPRFVQQPQGSNRKLCVSVFTVCSKCAHCVLNTVYGLAEPTRAPY